MYIKETFDVGSLEQAKHVVLTSDPNDPSKFERETTFLVDYIHGLNVVTEQSVVLDFGCGMGRVSKELIERFNCNVFGVDISESMLIFANQYVQNRNKFNTFNSYVTPNSIDLCVSALVLQHVEDPKKEIDIIHNTLKQDGYLVLLNEPMRWVPIGLDKNNYVIWNDDKFDVCKYIEEKFIKVSETPYINEKLTLKTYRKIT